MVGTEVVNPETSIVIDEESEYKHRPKEKKHSGQGGGEDSHIHKMLVLISAPLVQKKVIKGQEKLYPVQQLEVWEEIKAIVNACNEQKVSTPVQIELKIANQDEINHLNLYSSRLIIHFIGHGENVDLTTSLLLEDENGLAQSMSVEKLKGILKPGSHPCKLAFLNSCYSEELAKVFAEYAGVPHVLAISEEDEIIDLAARIFSKELYPALLKGETVTNSFLCAYRAVKYNDSLSKILDAKNSIPSNHLESKKFRLLPTDEGVHNKKLELYRSKGQVELPPWENTNLPTGNADPFIGRQVELYKLVCALHNKSNRCLLIRGIGGIGKTVLADALGRWEHERGRWKDGVWRIKLRNVKNINEARVQIVNQISDSQKDTLLLKSSDAINNTLLTNKLMTKEALLILDDLDNLLKPENKSKDDTIEFLRNLLECRDLKIIVTSRLFLPSTRVLHYRYDVPKMEKKSSLDTFEAYAFSGTKSKETVEDIKISGGMRTKNEIIKLLDGYPFPIRLAGSYVKQTKRSLKQLWNDLNENAIKIVFKDPDLTEEEQSRETSLRVTLELSYNTLSTESKEMFKWLAFFPSGISEKAASFIFGKESINYLRNLVNFSMAELDSSFSVKYYLLPEPARLFAEDIRDKTEISHHALKGLEFYYRFLQQTIIQLSTKKDISKEITHLLLEKPNLQTFLEWGYANEKQLGFCYSARITALLTDFLIKIVSNESESIKQVLKEFIKAEKMASSKSEIRQVLEKFSEANKIAEKNKDFVAKYYLIKSLGDIYKSGLLSKPDKLEASKLKARKKYVVALQELTPSLIDSQESLWEQANTHKARGDMYVSMQEWENAKPNYDLALKLYGSLLPRKIPNFSNKQKEDPLESGLEELLEKKKSQFPNNTKESYPKISMIRKVIDLIRQELKNIKSISLKSKKNKISH